MIPKIHILNGPNLNLLGQREPEIYGSTTLAEIEAACRTLGAELGIATVFTQTNSEGGLVDLIHAARTEGQGILINAAAYTHTSVAVLDALKTCDGIPVIEVHLSNPHRREEFRHTSFVSFAANGIVAGFGPTSYQLALRGIVELL
ncbi:MAG: type II 3-dehydroquinate dehydratase [Pseudomonadota bacterium]